MTEHPVGETRKERRWQRTVGIGAVVALFSLFGNFIQTAWYHHDEAQLQMSVSNKDAQIVHLLQQHSVTFKQQAKTAVAAKKTAAQTNVFLSDLGLLATYLIQSNEAVCAKTGANCPVLPTIPKIPSS